MTERFCIHVKSGKTFALVGENETGFMVSEGGKVKVLAPSTFKRYYKLLGDNLKIDSQKTVEECERIEEGRQQKGAFAPGYSMKYYKKYKRNALPLWDAIIDVKTNQLLVRDSEMKIIMICESTRTKECITVLQTATQSKRYFRGIHFNRARKHILYNQDIRTIQSIGKVFDKWIAAATIKM